MGQLLLKGKLGEAMRLCHTSWLLLLDGLLQARWKTISILCFAESREQRGALQSTERMLQCLAEGWS